MRTGYKSRTERCPRCLAVCHYHELTGTYACSSTFCLWPDESPLQAGLACALDELAQARRVLAHLSPEVLRRAARASDYDAEWYHQAGRSDDAETRHADAAALRQAAEEMER